MRKDSTNIVPFYFESHEVRAVLLDGEPWWVGKDVCEALGYTNPSKAMGDHCKGVTKRYPIVDSLGRTQEARVLSEADVLRLIVSSNLPEAQRFERWVFEEVLPAIRRTGGYAVRPVLAEKPKQAAGRLLGHMIAALAEFERALITERTRAGIRAAKRRGVKLGRKPALSPEQVAHACKLVEQGDSPGDVARLLGVARSTLYKALAG